MFGFIVGLVVASSSVGDVEQARVHQHLVGALTQLRAVGPEGFSADVWARRQASIARLERYTEGRVYPRNLHQSFRTPIFIDDFGTRCAMAHLIEASGGGAFVEKVRSERNFARVHQLIDEPELHAWLAQNGFTVDEAARVQPSYDSRPFCGPLHAATFCAMKGSLAEVLIAANDGRAVTGTVQRKWGPEAAPRRVLVDGGIVLVPPPDVGDSIVFFHYETGVLPSLAPGARIVVKLSDEVGQTWWALSDNQVTTTFDSLCAAPIRVSLEEALSRAQAPCCVEQTIAAGISAQQCIPNGAPGPFQFCGADGGRVPSFDFVEGGREFPVEACDGGFVASDAGTGADPEPTKPSGCSTTGVSLMCGVLAVLVRRLRATTRA